MRLVVFTIFDRAANAYLPPWYARSKGEAIRSFSEAVNDPSKSFGKYATDYALCELGEFDDNSGEFIVHGPVRLLAANEVIEQQLYQGEPMFRENTTPQ